MTIDLLLVNAFVTWFMLGVILVIQIVHYPLFSRVGREGFAAYQRAHERAITWVVFPPMAVELATAIALVARPPAGVPAQLLWVGLGLVGVIWASTAFLQVPQHTRLEAGFSADAHRKLVRTNWIRTAAWTLRAGLLAYALAAGR
ncbi:MAG: hypothetical protein SH809_05310 [Rhodothermales bacterium]|nr:hypothetical protein [Rhodothermales bacterium]